MAAAANSVTATVRECITSNRIYYVSTNGSDNNDGTSSSPFLSGSRALVEASKLDFNGYTVIIQFADGVYDGRMLIPKMVGMTTYDDLVLKGNVANPTNVVIRNTTSGQSAIEANHGTLVTVAALSVTAPNAGYGLNCSEGSVINVSKGVDFGDCSGGYHMYALNAGTINCFADYTISGPAKAHWCSGLNGCLYAANLDISTYGTSITFSYGFAAVFSGGSMQINNNTFTNIASISGRRFAAESCGSIQTFGAGLDYCPGSLPGVQSGGGIYQ